MNAIILGRNSGESMGCQMFEIRNFGWGLLEVNLVMFTHLLTIKFITLHSSHLGHTFSSLATLLASTHNPIVLVPLTHVAPHVQTSSSWHCFVTIQTLWDNLKLKLCPGTTVVCDKLVAVRTATTARMHVCLRMRVRATVWTRLCMCACERTTVCVSM